MNTLSICSTYADKGNQSEKKKLKIDGLNLYSDAHMVRVV